MRGDGGPLVNRSWSAAAELRIKAILYRGNENATRKPLIHWFYCGLCAFLCALSEMDPDKAFCRISVRSRLCVARWQCRPNALVVKSRPAKTPETHPVKSDNLSAPRPPSRPWAISFLARNRNPCIGSVLVLVALNWRDSGMRLSVLERSARVAGVPVDETPLCC